MAQPHEARPISGAAPFLEKPNGHSEQVGRALRVDLLDVCGAEGGNLVSQRSLPS